MLRGNLATRPFYNERLVSLLLLLVAVGVGALGWFNYSQFQRLSAHRGELNARIERDRAETEKIKADTARVRQSVDYVALRKLATETHDANVLIDQRTFSWTNFFGVIEDTLPYDVRLQTISPRVERGQFLMKITAVGKTAADLDEFLEKLLRTGLFRDPYWTDYQQNEDGSQTQILQALYLPAAPPEASRSTPPASGRGAPPRTGRGGGGQP
jgi:hypothetical protein